MPQRHTRLGPVVRRGSGDKSTIRPSPHDRHLLPQLVDFTSDGYLGPNCETSSRSAATG